MNIPLVSRSLYQPFASSVTNDNDHSHNEEASSAGAQEAAVLSQLAAAASSSSSLPSSSHATPAIAAGRNDRVASQATSATSIVEQQQLQGMNADGIAHDDDGEHDELLTTASNNASSPTSMANRNNHHRPSSHGSQGGQRQHRTTSDEARNDFLLSMTEYRMSATSVAIWILVCVLVMWYLGSPWTGPLPHSSSPINRLDHPCQPGYRLLSNECVACEPNHYCDVDTSDMIRCANNGISPAASWSPSNCTSPLAANNNHTHSVAPTNIDLINNNNNNNVNTGT